MSKDTAQMIACSIIGSRLNYCNALLAGMSEQNLNKLQRVQNSLARVVTGTRRRDHIIPVLADLHWLPVRALITFKICTLVYKVRVTQQPTYLAYLICDNTPARSLRSTSQRLLVEPPTRTVMGRRSFRYIAAKTWNNLPENLKTLNSLVSFRNGLKTFLFKLSYSD